MHLFCCCSSCFCCSCWLGAAPPPVAASLTRHPFAPLGPEPLGRPAAMEPERSRGWFPEGGAWRRHDSQPQTSASPAPAVLPAPGGGGALTQAGCSWQRWSRSPEAAGGRVPRDAVDRQVTFVTCGDDNEACLYLPTRCSSTCASQCMASGTTWPIASSCQSLKLDVVYVLRSLPHLLADHQPLQALNGANPVRGGAHAGLPLAWRAPQSV